MVVIEQNDEWLVGRRYLSDHSIAAQLEERNSNEAGGGGVELTAA